MLIIMRVAVEKEHSLMRAATMPRWSGSDRLMHLWKLEAHTVVVFQHAPLRTVINHYGNGKPVGHHSWVPEFTAVVAQALADGMQMCLM